VASGRTTTLDLGQLDPFGDLTELPDEVRALRDLTVLNLGNSQITVLPDWLAELPRLERIEAHDTRLTAVPALPGVSWALNAETLWTCARRVDPHAVFAVQVDPDTSNAALSHVVDLTLNGAIKLRELRVHGSVIGLSRAFTADLWKNLGHVESSLDTLLRGQAGLESMQVWGCPLGRVPDALSELHRLQKISLGGVWPDHLPDWLFLFPDLRRLDLPYNSLVDLPSAVGEARRLMWLNLCGNEFTHVPEGVWNLSALETLWLDGCPIVEIPAGILRLGKLKDLRLEKAFASPPELPQGFVRPPPEIAVQGIDAIKNYWRQEREVGVDYLAEAKLLIVGEPGAGKTTLAKKLLDPAYVLDSGEQSTEGIDVSAWQFPSVVRVQPDGGEEILQCTFRANIWDFGGQEIYHATHQFFLTRRSVYVLVTDERKEDTDFEYWLEVVNLLSDGSPILIVHNQKQGRQRSVDSGELRRRYPNLRPPLTLNLADRTSLQPAVTQIRRELEQLPHIGTPLPKTWRDVRVALESDPRDHVSAEEFFQVCTAHGFRHRDDMRQLGGYLHDLGICLFFQDDELLSRTVVLNPEWGTGAVYRVLDDPSIARNLGVFDRADLRRIWHEPAYSSMRAELLRLMMRFGLCYQVPGSDTFVAPQLLSPARPSYPWDGSDNLVMRYEYEVMPKGIVRRLIVALHDLIQPGESVWRTGVLLEHDLTQAEIVEEYRRRRLTIRLRGGDPRVLLAIVDRELATIHRSYPAIRFERLRPCDCERCAVASEPSMFTIRELLDFARDGDGIQCRVSRGLRDPVGLLSGLYLDPARAIDPAAGSRPTALVQPEVFVSYHWGGEADALVDEIQQRMSERGVHITRDRDEVNYRDSIEKFMRRLGAGKAVVVVLDKAYLRSRNCLFELTRIAQDRGFAARIFPIVMADAGIFDAVERVRHIKYWENKRDELDEAMRSVGQENLHGIREELDLYETIRNTIAGILDVLGDMNTLTEQNLRADGFEHLYRSLEAALDLQKIHRSE
jgi:internalin A